MTIKELQREAAIIGYRLVPNTVNTKWLRCTCGSREKIRIYGKGDSMKVICKGCGFSITAEDRTRAVQKWNEAIINAREANDETIDYESLEY